MLTIKKQDWQTIPEYAQQEVYDFFLFVQNKYTHSKENNDIGVFTNHSANLINEWKDNKEDEIWK